MCCNKNCKCIISIIISLIIAIIVGVLYSSTVLTSLSTLLYIIIGLSSFFLLMFILTLIFGKRKDEICICNNGSCLLIGTLGAIISASILLAITVTETAIALIFGIVTFFSIFAIIEFLILILCFIKNSCMCKE